MLTEEQVESRLEALTAHVTRAIETIGVGTRRRHRFVLLVAAADGVGTVHHSDNLYEQERNAVMCQFGAHLINLAEGKTSVT